MEVGSIYYIRHSYILFLSIDWLKVCHVIKNKLTILQKLGQSRKGNGQKPAVIARGATAANLAKLV